MRICIPTDDDQGLSGAVAGHFGRAPFLTLVDVDSGEVSVVANRPHGEGHCNPVAAIAGHGVGAVLCAGAGRRAVAALEGAGIRVLVTGAIRVEDAVADLRTGGARPLSAGEACGGHHGAGGCHA